MAKAAYEAPKAGEVFDIGWPFVRTVFDYYDEDGPTHEISWKPGYISEQIDEYDAGNYCHGAGKAKFMVIDVHRLPHPYPARVFYTRTWADPDGKAFGKKKLLTTTIPAFRRLVSHSGFDRLHVDGDYADLSETEKNQLLAGV